MWKENGTGSLFLSILFVLLALPPNRALVQKSPMESSLCELLAMLNDSSLEKVYFNDDTSSDYKFLTGLENSQNRLLVAVRNQVNLVLIHFIDATSYKEYLLKVC